jgi:hypothetical protein
MLQRRGFLGKLLAVPAVLVGAKAASPEPLITTKETEFPIGITLRPDLFPEGSIEARVNWHRYDGQVFVKRIEVVALKGPHQRI